MIDPVSLVVGAGIALTAYALGRLDHRRRRAPTGEPPPICGCGHHFAQHDPDTNRCHARTEGLLPCTCRRYAGPIPLNRYLAPELTDTEQEYRQ
jgi:hypothetical protein